MKEIHIKVRNTKFVFNFIKVEPFVGECICQTRCPLNNFCSKIRNPIKPMDQKESFCDFCSKDDSSRKNEFYMPDPNSNDDILKFVKKTDPTLYKTITSEIFV